MKESTPLPVARKLFTPVRLVIALVCLIALIAGIAGLTLHALGVPKTTTSKQGLATPTPTATRPIATSTPSFQSVQFTSPQLGIAFTYAPQLSGATIATKQVGAFVYVYDSSQRYTDGQYVQVLQKSPQETLQQAISANILKGYNPSNCTVGPARGSSPTYPSSYATASITYATSTDPNGGWPTANPTNCPAAYTIAPEGGFAYFLTDSQHPDKLLFISIGLEGINATTDPSSQRLWQDTITFQ